MKKKLLFRRQASEDLVHAIQWYESKRRGLGHQMLLSAEACLSTISTDPERFPIKYEKLRKAQLKRFPYAVYYLIDEDKIVVVAVLHAKRDPGELAER